MKRVIPLVLALGLSSCGGEDRREPTPVTPSSSSACVPGANVSGCTCTQVDVGVDVGSSADVKVHVCCDSTGCRAVGAGKGRGVRGAI